MAKASLALAVVVVFFAVCASGATFTVTNINDSGPGSLRQAILDANVAGGTVAFNIATTPRTILLSTGLPVAEAGVIIDGTTQPGYFSAPVVEISGANIPNTGAQPCVSTKGTVRGVAVTRCSIGIDGIGAPVIAANYIGFPVTTACCNSSGNGVGVRLLSPGTGAVIGGSTFGDGNVISFNNTGILSDFVSGITISHDKIGTDPSGNSSATNSTDMFLADGSNFTITFNVISGGPGFGGSGIKTQNASNVIIKNNLIGLGVSGNTFSAGTCIRMQSTSSATIGDLSGGGNTIANCSVGIALLVSGNGNVIRGNSIYVGFFGFGLGIDLSTSTSLDGQTPNDPGDPDTGPNNLQNYPVLTRSTSIGGTTTIAGTFNSTPNQAFTLDFYWSDAGCNGGTQAKNYLGSLPVTTDGSGNANINTSFAVATPAGGSVTALAVDAGGNTSEFSPCVSIEGPGVFRLNSMFVSVSEGGGSIPVVVTRANGAVGTATVNYATADGTATAGADYTATSGTLTFADGETSKTVNVPILQDTIFEGFGGENFTFNLSNPTGGATLGSPSTATITIVDDDPAPQISIADAQVVEGNSGITPMNFTVTLSAPAGVPISFQWETVNLTTSSNDFQSVCCPIVTFNPGETVKTLTVNVNGDTTPEPDETFEVDLFGFGNASFARSRAIGKIINDDPPLAITVTGASVLEGNSGTSLATVTLTANAPISGSLSYATADITARAGQDYQAVSGNVFFSNQTTATIQIPIIGDTAAEPDETFKVVFSNNNTGATLSAPAALVTILNDDVGFGPPLLSVPVGGKAEFVLDFGATVPPPTTVTFSSSNGGVLDVPASAIVSSASTVFDFPALAKGATAITVTVPAPFSRTFTSAVTVFEPANFVLTPNAINIPVGTSLTMAAKFDPPLTATTTVQLQIGDTSVVDIPTLITINPGQTTTFTAKALQKGSTVLVATLSTDHGGARSTYFVDVTDAPKTPTIAQIAPANGPVAGGTDVTINGANLAAGCTLMFGGVPATNVAFVSATSLTATTPAHTAGSVDVALSCGTDSFNFASGFTYTAATPTISSVAPSFGSTAGGTLVRIDGTNFRSGCWPFFDNAAARTATFVSRTEMIGETPAHDAGKAGVTIRCSNTPDASLTNAFTYSTAEEPSPQISSVVPLAGSPGEPVTLTGVRFRRDDSVKFDATGATILSTAPDEDVVRIPDVPPGDVAITLTDRAGRATTTGPIFTVLEPVPPHIDSATPSSLRPGTDIQLDGTGFRPGYSYAFGTSRAFLASLSYTRVLLRVPDIAPGVYPLNVLNAAGKIASIGPSVTVAAAGPSISNIAPACSSTDGGRTMTIHGGGFDSGATVSFDGVLAPAHFVDAGTLTVTIPAGAVGSPSIVITNPGGASATLSGAFFYYSPFDPAGGCSGGRDRPTRH